MTVENRLELATESGHTPPRAGDNLVVAHFWKLFATAALILVAYGAYSLSQMPDEVSRRYWWERESSRRLEKLSEKLSENQILGRCVGRLSANQSREAIVRLKNRDISVSGFLSHIEDSFLVLATHHHDSGETETVLIPLENIAWISARNRSK